MNNIIYGHEPPKYSLFKALYIGNTNDDYKSTQNILLL